MACCSSCAQGRPCSGVPTMRGLDRRELRAARMRAATGEAVGEDGGRQAGRGACAEYGPAASYACGEVGAYVGKRVGGKLEDAIDDMLTEGTECPFGDPADGAQEQMWAIAQQINPQLAAEYFTRWRAQVESQDLNGYQEACLLRGYAADILRQGRGAGASCGPGFVAGPGGKCIAIGSGQTTAGQQSSAAQARDPSAGPPPPPPQTHAPVFLAPAAIRSFARMNATESAPASKGTRAAVGGGVGAVLGASLGAATLVATGGKVASLAGAKRAGIGAGVGLALGAALGFLTGK